MKDYDKAVQERFEKRVEGTRCNCGSSSKYEFEERLFCEVCKFKMLKDCKMLLDSPSTINHERMRVWLNKYKDTPSLMFINGHFNAHPEALSFSEEELCRHNIKGFWESFKYR